MNYFRSLIQQSLSRSREATLGVLGINDEGLREHLSNQMSNALGDEGCFLASPVFEHTFGWEPSESTLESLSGNLLCPAMVNNLAKAKNYSFPLSARPYMHQLMAWKTLLDETPRSVVITSGTGSGKTECFMVPILNDLILEQQRLQEPLVGVRALFLYPLNALINSQQERLDAWTKSFGSNIRFCLYNGNTEESEHSVRKLQQIHHNQQLSRESLRKEPAPILLTNATMLEYMLVRQVDSPILDVSRRKQSLRWIVLDEAHTYIGSQAAELSLLLRRVVQAFGRKSEDIRFIATSATIADKGAKEKLQEYLAGLAGVSTSQVEVIGGSRVWPEITPYTVKPLPLKSIESIEQGAVVSEARFTSLEQSDVATVLRHAIVSHDRPRDLDELVQHVADKLKGCTAEDKQQEVLEWLDLMTGTQRRAGEPPFLKLRVHIFQRMLHGLWTCVDSGCPEKTEALKNWPFGNVYVSQRGRCECQAPVYELAFCEECRTPHLVAEESRTGELHQCNAFAGDEFALNYDVSDDDESLSRDSVDISNNTSRQYTLAGGATAHEQYQTVVLDGATNKLGLICAERPITIRLAFSNESVCSRCGVAAREGYSFLRKAYLGAPFYVANAVPTVLEYCPDPDKEDCRGLSPAQLPARGRKLITFTDSRQGTARMAVRMQQEAERSKLRGLTFQILRNMQVKQEAQQPDAPQESYDELIKAANVLEKAGLDNMAKERRAKAEQLKSGIASKTPPATLTWNDLSRDLSTSADVDQFILDYNRYANPALFSGNESGLTMARLLLAREYGRRPKNYNSTETVGLISVKYQGLEKITKAPQFWEDTSAISTDRAVIGYPSKLTVQDWIDFLKVALDFHVRENTFIPLERTMQSWMGSRFFPKSLLAPDSDEAESSSIKKWPQAKSIGQPHRLVKLLELATGFDKSNAVHRDKINVWLKQAWKDLTQKTHILEAVDSGWALKLETLTFSLPTEIWLCPVTYRLMDTTFRGLTPYLPSGRYRENDFRCTKKTLPALSKLTPDSSATHFVQQIRELVSSNKEINALRKESLWTDINDRIVEGGFYYRTAEHSAQQSSAKLEKYEDLFKAGKVNVLNCSTTMEMGVDIGGVSAVVMNNVPPHPANYLQRAGRAGRRSESRAIAYTLCKNNPHDQRVFKNPKWPFYTAIPAPGITLSSNRIVKRHVHSLVLSIFLRTCVNTVTERTKLNLAWFFGNGAESICNRFIIWLETGPKELEEPVQRLVMGTGLAGRAFQSIFSEGITTLRGLQEKWDNESQILQARLAAATDQAFRRALELELKRHQEEYLLKELSSKAFLPGYGFPTNVVTLNTFNIEDFKASRRWGGKGSREDNVFISKEQPSRGLDIAIREYAPGSQIVVDGRVYRSAGVSLQWHAQGQRKEAQAFQIAWRCNTCGATGVTEKAYSQRDNLRCSHCQSMISFSEAKMVLRPEGFTTDFYEPTCNDISSQKFIKVERPRIQLVGDSVNLPESLCGYVCYGHDGTVFYHSSGESEKGYAICMACGRAESMSASGDIPHNLSPDRSHRPLGGPQSIEKERECSGNVMTSIHLGFKVQTDVLELFLRNPLTRQWLTDSHQDQTIAATIAVALRDEIASQLGINTSEMGFGFRLDKELTTNQGRSVIQIFDVASGGAGFVIEGVRNIVNLLEKTIQRLKCPADCDNICAQCLAENDSRVELEELDRHAALAWFVESDFLTSLTLPEKFTVIPGARYCSIDPQSFIRSSMSKSIAGGEDRALQIFVHNAPKNWDLAYPDFREQLLSWHIIDKYKVRLILESVSGLDESDRRSLHSLMDFGIEVMEASDDSKKLSVPVVVQIVSGLSCYSLLSNETVLTHPGENWLKAPESCTLISSQQLVPFDGIPVSISDWQKSPAGSHVLEITTELNGDLLNLASRLKTLIKNNVPNFAQLLENDRVQAITYSDRYLKSPWSLMLLSGFLYLFKGDDLSEVHIQTVKSHAPSRGFLIDHDWYTSEDQEEILVHWVKDVLSCLPILTIVEKSYELLHGRVITIDWVSGKQSKLMLDQGMGYWKPQLPFKDDRIFDFDCDVQIQVKQMAEIFCKANMRNGGKWPTFITVLAEA